MAKVSLFSSFVAPVSLPRFPFFNPCDVIFVRICECPIEVIILLSAKKAMLYTGLTGMFSGMHLHKLWILTILRIVFHFSFLIPRNAHNPCDAKFNIYENQHKHPNTTCLRKHGWEAAVGSKLLISQFYTPSKHPIIPWPFALLFNFSSDPWPC